MPHEDEHGPISQLFEQLPLSEVTRVVRRTVFGALIVGAVAFGISLALSHPLIGLGVCVGLALGLANIRLVSRVGRQGERFGSRIPSRASPRDARPPRRDDSRRQSASRSPRCRSESRLPAGSRAVLLPVAREPRPQPLRTGNDGGHPVIGPVLAGLNSNDVGKHITEKCFGLTVNVDTVLSTVVAGADRARPRLLPPRQGDLGCARQVPARLRDDRARRREPGGDLDGRRRRADRPARVHAVRVHPDRELARADPDGTHAAVPAGAGRRRELHRGAGRLRHLPDARDLDRQAGIAELPRPLLQAVQGALPDQRHRRAREAGHARPATLRQHLFRRTAARDHRGPLDPAPCIRRSRSSTSSGSSSTDCSSARCRRSSSRC